MSKPDTYERPMKGGSFVRDPDTGKLDRKHHTKPAPTRDERKAAAEKAEADKAKKEAGKAPATPASKKEG